MRVIPDGHRDVPPTAIWPAFRKRLRDAGVRPPRAEPDAPYCKLADMEDDDE